MLHGPPDGVPARRTTVLRSFRLDEGVAQVLVDEARRQGVSVNALVSRALTKYVEWDRFAERYGFVSLTRDGYRRMHDFLPEADVERVATEVGATYPKETALFFFKRLGVDSFVRWLELTCRYARWAEAEVRPHGRGATIVVRHGLGPRYSRFLGAYLRSAARAIGRIEVTAEVHDGSVSIEIPTLPGPSAP